VVQTVPPFPAHAAVIHNQNAALRPDEVPEPVLQRLQQAQSEIEATSGGKHYGELVQRHFPEAQRLVNTNRRVAAVWRRNGGPEIVRALLRTMQSSGHSLPLQINGKPIAQCLSSIQGAFVRYCSEAFAADLKQYGPSLAQLAGLAYPQILEALRQHPKMDQ
jgi:hypothetical protein